ncbi:MAG TPA: hypothetical protein VFG59_21055 [Anaeromyxobacter sp.]|nr:hypothetical protein [Anaeromyxobacter sp.]
MPELPVLPVPEVPVPGLAGVPELELPVPELPAAPVSVELPVPVAPVLDPVAAPPAPLVLAAPVPADELCPLGWPDLLLGQAMAPDASKADSAALSHHFLTVMISPPASK